LAEELPIINPEPLRILLNEVIGVELERNLKESLHELANLLGWT